MSAFKRAPDSVLAGAFRRQGETNLGHGLTWVIHPLDSCEGDGRRECDGGHVVLLDAGATKLRQRGREKTWVTDELEAG